MRNRPIVVFQAAAIIFAAPLTHAADPVPYVVKDLSETRAPASSSPYQLTVAGNYAYFFAKVQGFGSQLWRTDGTPGGSVPLANMPSRSTAYDPKPAVLGTTLIFSNANSAQGQELWKSDGTAAGTVLVSDICLGTCSSNPTGFTEYGGAVFFAANDGVHGVELWRTDGTAAGTWLVSDAAAGYSSLSPSLLVAGPGGVLFAGGSQGLWTSTGARGNVTKISSTTPRTALVAHGGLVFFTADDSASDRELWKSDGTEAGTGRVRDINPTGSSSPTSLVSSSAGLLFAASDGTSGIELWKSDGTAAGTVLVKDIAPSGSSSPAYLTAIGSTVYFAATDGTSGVELWSTSGTSAGTIRIADLQAGSSGSYPRYLAKVSTSLFFADSSGRLWICNGAAVAMVKDFWSGATNGVTLVAGADKAFVDLRGAAVFAADDGPHGSEPWVSNGTAVGTVMLADADPGASSGNPQSLRTSGSNVFFIANDDAYEAALWKTDGTAAGTRALSRIDPYATVSYLTDLKGTLFYSVKSYVPGGQLWKSDGTAAGTVLVKALDGQYGQTLQMRRAGDALFFPWNTAANGTELWRSDGTAAGTALVRDIEPGSASSSPSYLVAWGSTLVFTAVRADSGLRVWKSDGMEAGTTLLADLPPAAAVPRIMLVAGDRLYVRSAGTLWAIALAQTRSLDLFGLGLGLPEDFGAFGSRLVFAVSDGRGGIEPWMWDGTSVSPALLKDINPGSGDSSPHGFRYSGGTLLFAADDGVHGVEPWKSDGTEAGTVMLRDIVPGSASSLATTDDPTFTFFVVGGAFYFVADDGVHGRELWISDGTSAGTRLVADINPGAGASDPASFVTCRGRLYFTAYAPGVGRELFALDLVPAQVSPGPKRRSVGRP
ncbi:MAG: ELWxxDGT repeat protein [Thermoanaerobaculia bacterium]